MPNYIGECDASEQLFQCILSSPSYDLIGCRTYYSGTFGPKISNVATVQACMAACDTSSTCLAWSHRSSDLACWLQTTVYNVVSGSTYTGGSCLGKVTSILVQRSSRCLHHIAGGYAASCLTAENENSTTTVRFDRFHTCKFDSFVVHSTNSVSKHWIDTIFIEQDIAFHR
jgi:hypothetical protein